MISRMFAQLKRNLLIYIIVALSEDELEKVQAIFNDKLDNT